MMFQDIALFPHLTVDQNIGFGLEVGLNQKRSNEFMNYLILLAYITWVPGIHINCQADSNSE